MPLVQKPFADIVTFSRASGATRVNAAGLIVGVDFSATSVTIGTGAKTFTLAATANVNRDWPVGSAVRAVDQVGGGAMIGAVTSYSPVTQELVINVTSITGSGTSTNWRIGSLEFRRDFDPVTLAPRGGLVEGQATNAEFPSVKTSIGSGDGTSTSAANTTITAPDGSIGGVVMSPANDIRYGTYYSYQFFSAAAGIATESVFCNPDAALLSSGFFGQRDPGDARFFRYSFATEAMTGTAADQGRVMVQKLTGGWYRFAVSYVYSGALDIKHNWVAGTTDNTPSSVVLWGFQYESNPVASSYIPTTTVAVTRAADLPNVDGQRLLDFYNNEGGVLYVEATPLAAAVSAVAASLNDGTLNNAIRIGQKQSGTLSSIRAIASDGVTDVMALNATVGTLRSNGIDYAEISHPNLIAKLGAASSGVGNFLVCGPADQVTTTSDSGLSYTERSFQNALAGAHFGIGRFVIATSAITGNPSVNSGTVIVSTDGLSFRRVNIPGLTQNLNEVTSNGTNQYVAVGAGGVIYTSPDAETWTAQTSGTTQALNGADYGSIGGTPYYYTAGDGNQSVRRSTDGVTWNALTVDNVSYADIAIGNGQIVLCRNGGDGYSSLDGTTFTTNPSLGNVAGAVYSAALGLWIAVGPTGRIVTATDPSGTWTSRTSGTTQNLNEVQLFGSTIVAVGAAQTVLTSTDAVTWTARTANVNSTLSGIATNGTRLLICGSSGAIATSDDGATFTSRTGNSAQLNGAAFGNGTYVVVGDAANGSGLIATVDPTTFAYTRRVSGTTQPIVDVVFLNGMFFALSVGTQGILTSADGITWTPRSTSNSAFFGAAYSGAIYVVAANAGNINTSPNGTTWTLNASIISGFTGNWLDCSYSNGIFVIVGSQGRIATSANGTTWTSRTSGVASDLYAVRWNTRDQCFYAAGDSGVILRSADGTTWENIANDAVTAIIKAGQIKANPNPGNWVPGQVNRVVTRFNASGMASSINGGAVASDSSVEVIVPNRLSLGMDGTSAQQFNGHLRRIGYRTDSISDANLVEVSAGNVDFFTASQGGLA